MFIKSLCFAVPHRVSLIIITQHDAKCQPFFSNFFPFIFFCILEASFHCVYTSICTLNTKSWPINTDYFLFSTNNLTQDNFHQYGLHVPSFLYILTFCLCISILYMHKPLVYIGFLYMYKHLVYAYASYIYVNI